MIIKGPETKGWEVSKFGVQALQLYPEGDMRYTVYAVEGSEFKVHDNAVVVPPHYHVIITFSDTYSRDPDAVIDLGAYTAKVFVVDKAPVRLYDTLYTIRDGELTVEEVEPPAEEQAKEWYESLTHNEYDYANILASHLGYKFPEDYVEVFAVLRVWDEVEQKTKQEFQYSEAVNGKYAGKNWVIFSSDNKLIFALSVPTDEGPFVKRLTAALRRIGWKNPQVFTIEPAWGEQVLVDGDLKEPRYILRFHYTTSGMFGSWRGISVKLERR